MAFITEADVGDTEKLVTETGPDHSHRFKLRITAQDKKQMPVEIEPSKAKKLPLFKNVKPKYDLEVMRIKSYAK